MKGLNPQPPGQVLHRVRLLRGLAGRVLSCGCLVGVYETYSGAVIATIDARGSFCRQADHRLHSQVELSAESDHPTIGPSDHRNIGSSMPR